MDDTNKSRGTVNGVVLLVLCLSIITTTLVYQVLKTDKLTDIKNEHEYILNNASLVVTKQITNIKQSSFLIFQYIKDRHKDKQTFNPSVLFNQVEALLPNISQVRVLDTNGMELVRVNIDNGNPVNVPKNQLQNKSQRDYYYEAKSLKPGELYLSTIDLNIENGEIVKPIEPTIRAVYYWDLEKRYYLVINYRLTDLYSTLKSLSTKTSDLKVSSRDGYYLVHSEAQKEWSISYNNRDITLAGEYPTLADLLIEKPKTNFFFDNDLGYVSGLTLNDLSSGDTLNDKTTKSDANDLTFLVLTSKQKSLALFLTTYIYSTVAFVLAISIFGYVGYKEISQQKRLRSLNELLQNEQEKLRQTLIKEQKLKKELVQAEKMASLGFLVAGVAHELNTPIGAAKMTASNLKQMNEEFTVRIENGISKEQLINTIDGNIQGNIHISNCLQKSGEIIKRFKRLAIDRNEEEVQELELMSIIKDVTESMGPIMRESQVNISIDGPDSVQMTSYPGTISQTIQNIVRNSIDHAFEGISYRVIELYVNETSDEVVVSIKDNGRGLDPSITDVFEPFATTARGKGNTGLGLHLVHQWVHQLLQGNITIGNNEEEGVKTVITLPKRVQEDNA